MKCPKCKKLLKTGDAVVITKGVGRWSAGDFSYIVYEDKNYIDIEDANGGKRGKKGRFGIQRVKKDYLLCFDCVHPNN